MRPRFSWVLAKSALLAGFLIALAGVESVQADDPGFLGRLFRLGGSAPSNPAAPAKSARPLPYGHDPGSIPADVPSMATGLSSPSSASPTFDRYPLPSAPAQSTTFAAPTGPLPQRLAPRPRVSSAITSADPILTRLALGRSNDGSQFGMFLQIFADGTVVDSEGVHHLRPADIKPILDTIQSGELYRIKGHCGAPATDFIEYVHIVAYEHRLGRLMAHSFSYSGNPQGCDHTIRHIHTALETLQAKLSGQPAVNAPVAANATTAPVPSESSLPPGPTPLNLQAFSPATIPSMPSNRQPAASATNLGAAAPLGAVIPLTPVDSPR